MAEVLSRWRLFTTEEDKPVGDVARDVASFAADRQMHTATDTLSDNKGRLWLAASWAKKRKTANKLYLKSCSSNTKVNLPTNLWLYQP